MDEPALNDATARVARLLLQQSDAERAHISGTLHDELGGLLVAAKMDLGWLENSVGTERPDLRARFAQVRDYLDTAIAVERRIVEELQPGLLLHIGLFAALQWYVQQERGQSNRQITVQVPESEVSLPPAARVALYRAVQDALRLSTADIDLTARGAEHRLRLEIGPLPNELSPEAQPRLLIILHRVCAVGGHAQIVRDPSGSGRLVIELRTIAPSD
jgi:signal transduction histidine kinase